MHNETEEDSFITKIRVDDISQNREHISSNKTFKLFTYAKSNHFETELNYQRQLLADRKESEINGRIITTATTTTEQSNMPFSSSMNKDDGEASSSSQQHRQQQEPKTSSARSVDELLKMLSGRGVSTTINKTPQQQPPPLPPKPKPSAMNNNSRGFMNFFQTKTNTTANQSRVENESDVVDFISSRTNEHESEMLHDNTTAPNHDYIVSSKQTQQQQQQMLATSKSSSKGVKKVMELHEHFPLENSTTAAFVPKQTPATANDDKHAIRPIVTESPEEANNNNISNHQPNHRPNYLSKKPTTTTTTVEILEVPSLNKHSNNKYNIEAGDIYENSNNQTFSRLEKQQQLFYDNNNCSYSDPVVTTSATDDDDEDDENDDNYEVLPTELEVESILNDSLSKNEPPRTSTPNNSTKQNFSSITQNRESNNNNFSKTQDFKTIGQSLSELKIAENQNNFEQDNILNVSQETDELNDTSGGLLDNSSGGGELIGINDNSDLINNSKRSVGGGGATSTSLSQNPINMPYTVQLFNETIMSSSNSPPSNKQQFTNSGQRQYSPPSSSSSDQRVRELEKLTNSLLEHVDKLQSQVSNLTAKVDELQLQSSEQQKSMKSLACENNQHNKNNLVSNISSFKQSDQSFVPLNKSTSNNLGFSKSAININKLSSNAQQQQQQNPTSTYSRNNIATISRNANHNNQSINQNSSLYGGNNNRLSPSGSSATKSLRKTNVHASTNSLYDSAANSSISPNSIHHHQSYKQTTSPNSTMSLSSHRRDPTYYTSMLSLSSLGGQSSNPTTLSRKASAVSGSTLNLSRVGSQLVQQHWPSQSDFITSKQQAKEIYYSHNERLVKMVLYNTLINMTLPNWIKNDYNLDKVVEPPSVKLKLDWVYGYRGRDCRSNIFYLPTGECVYFVASIIVLYNPDQRTQRHYLSHTDSVKCLAVHPNKLIIASGQSAVSKLRDKRPIVRVWNTINLSTLRVIGFNEDFDRSICCLAFSKHDQGATLAVVDESTEHTITLLDWQRDKNWRLAETNSGHDPVLAIDFHPIDKYSLVAVGRSNINFWDTRGMTMTKKAGLFDKYDKPKYVLCLAFNDLGDTITGDSNGNLIIWPRGANRPSKIIHDAHNGGVFSVLAMKDGSYLTGGRDRRIVEWDENFARTGREAELPEHCGGVRYITYARGSQVLIGTLKNSILLGSLDDNFVLIMQGHAEATTAFAIHPNQNQYLTGGFDDQIHMFDSKTHSVLWTRCLMMPATAASFSNSGNLLIVGSTLGKWLVIDVTTQEFLFTKCEGTGTINCIKYSPNGEYFCLGSSDMQTYIYKTNETENVFTRIGTCVGHSAPVKEIDWSDDSRYLQTQSMNLELLFWKALNCRPLEDTKIIADLKWFTNNCTIGFHVMGLWSDSNDSLINFCDKSNESDLMASATDTGNINIFKWPPCYNQCLSQKYYGNVEKFDFIKFLPDDSKLIAVGSRNCVTTEWAIERDTI